MSTADTSERARRIQDIIGVFVMSITAVLTAWCGFQASKWGGEMSISFSQASSARVQAAAAEGEARAATQIDLSVYLQWAIAVTNGQEEVAEYIQDRFTPAFATAFDAWVAEGMVETSPLARDDYVPDGTDEAAELSARADVAFQTALENNRHGDGYSLLTVLFALVLFLAAMSQRDVRIWVGRTLLGLAIAFDIAGIVVLLTYPVIV